MPDAGSVWVDVLPDTRKFGPKLRSELQKHAAKGIDIPVSLDSKTALAELERFEKRVDDLSRKAAGISVTANTRPALASLVGVEKALDRIDGRVVTARIRTTGGAVPGIATPRVSTPRTSSSASGAGSFDTLFQSRITRALAALPMAGDGRMSMLRGELADLGSRSVGVDMDAATALTLVRELQNELAVLSRDPDIDVRVNAAQAHAELAALRAQIEKIDDSRPTIRPRVLPAADKLEKFSDASPAAMTAVAALVPPAIPAVGAAVGGVAGLLPGLTAGLTGLGATALAVVPGLMGIGKAMDLQKKAAGGSEAAMEAYQEALDKLTPSAREVMDELADLGSAFTAWHEALQPETMPVVARGIRLVKDNLDSLSPIVSGSAKGFDNLLASAERGLAGAEWQQFMAFASRQAEPTLTSLGRTVGSLTLGITGLAVSFEPLWNSMSQGMERGAAGFAAWANEADNFTDFISWTIENGPTLLGVLGDVSSAAIDLGVALAPMGLVYAQGIGLLAQGISWLADNAPGLLQLAVAAGTAKIALDLFSRVNAGVIQPLRELPGRLRDYGDQIRNAGVAADGAAGGTSRFRNALGGAVGALGGPWGLAITAGVAALGLFAAAKANASDKVREYTDAIREDSGAVGENARAHAIQSLEEEKVLERAEKLGLNLGIVTDAVLGQTNAQKTLNRELNTQLDILGERLAQGEITQEQYDTQYRLIAQVRGAVQGENDAINEAVGAYRRQTEAVGGSTGAQMALNDSMTEGAFLARDLKSALDSLTGSTVGVTEAESNFQAAIDAATESAATNGATLDLNTEQGRANEATLRTLRDTVNANTAAVEANGGSIQEQTETAARGRAEFIRVARQMGLTAKEAEELADEYLGIPSEVNSAIEVSAKGTWFTVPNQNTAHMSPSNGQSQFYAEGGAVHGPGTATSDSIPAWLSDGEFVQPTHVVDHYGVGFMEALRQKRVPKGGVPGFAKGGWVTRGAGDTAAAVVNDHRMDVRENYRRLVEMLIGSIGDSMAEDFKNSTKGPMGVVQLAEASLGKYPESGGNNTNAITRWFGMNGAPWCFAAGTLVQTGTGLVEIQDIVPGDTVRTPSGTDRTVRAAYRRTKPLLRVRILGAPDTLATADHPYMTERGWVKAGQLRRGDKVAKPIPATGSLRVDDDFAHLVGLYVAEGYRGHRDRSVTLCVARGEAEDVAALAKRAGYEPHIAQHRTCALVTVYDRALYELLAAAGDGAHRKEVPSFVLEWDARGRGRFLEGYVSGDGHRPPSRPGVAVATTVSKRLTVSLAGLLSTLGVSAAIRSTRPARTEAIEGRTVSCREQFVIEWREHPSRKAQHRFDEAVLWVPVRSVVDTGVVDTVYDIQVDDEHAFIANGVHVHNCAMFISWLFAQTGASRALGGASRTAWTGDYYGSGMARTNSPQPGDVAVYGTRHVNLIASPGGGRRIGGNQSNNVTAAPYSGGAIFRPMWDRARFAAGGLVSIADIFGQDREEDHRGGMSPLVKTIREISGYAKGGVASGLAVVGEQGPELAYFDDPARIYSNAESKRMLTSAAKVSTTSRGGDGASAAPMVGTINASIHSADATVREMVDEITHSLHTVRVGGRFADD